MAQHMTTMELIRSRTLQEQFTAALTDLVLVDHGTGRKRHRAFTLAEIAALIAGGSLNPIVLEGSGGGQNFTLTINHNSITCVKSATGGASVTTKIDFNGESILPTVNADTIKAKTLHGTTVEGQTYKLVIDTITEILGNVVIGASDAKKNVTIHGDLTLDGNIVSNVDFGTQETPAGITVHANADVKGTTTSGKVHTDEIKSKTANGTINVKSAVDIDDTLNVDGNATFGGSINALSGSSEFKDVIANSIQLGVKDSGESSINGAPVIVVKSGSSYDLDTWKETPRNGDKVIVACDVNAYNFSVTGTGLSSAVTLAQGEFCEFVHIGSGTGSKWFKHV